MLSILFPSVLLINLLSLYLILTMGWRVNKVYHMPPLILIGIIILLIVILIIIKIMAVLVIIMLMLMETIVQK